MKFVLSLFLCLFASSSIWAQSRFEKLKKEHRENAALYKKLTQFESKGVEKSLELQGVKLNKFLKTVQKYKGTKYKSGGCSKSGMDCSGLVKASFEKNGVSVPRTANELARYGKIITQKKNLKKGDLIFFTNTYKTSRLVTHVAIYLGDGKMIHTSSKKGVIITPLDDPYYWNKHYLFATRIF